MAAPAHTRITFSGVFGSTTQPIEIWAFNLSARPVLGTQPPGNAQMAADVAAAYTTHLKPLYDTDVTLTRVRIASLGPEGLVSKDGNGAYNQVDHNTAVSGANGAVAANRKPLQTALVVSLTTGRAGPTGKGRFFLPWPSPQLLDTEYRISATQAATNAASAKAFLNAVSTAVGAPLVVASGGSVKPGGLGPALTNVTGVRVGRVPDTMRSRRSALLEGYSALSLA